MEARLRLARGTRSQPRDVRRRRAAAARRSRIARAPARRRRRSPDRRALVRTRGGRAARRHAPARGRRSRGDVTEALALAGARNAGRCGFLVSTRPPASPVPSAPAGRCRRRARARRRRARDRSARGRDRPAARPARLIVDTFEEARRLARTAAVPVATAAAKCSGAPASSRADRARTRAAFSRPAPKSPRCASRRRPPARMSTACGRGGHAGRGHSRRRAALAGRVARQHDHEKAIVSLEGDVRRTSRRSRARRPPARDGRPAICGAPRKKSGRRTAPRGIRGGHRPARGAAARRPKPCSTASPRGCRPRAKTPRPLRQLSEARTEQAALTERLSALELEVARLEEAARDSNARHAAARRTSSGPRSAARSCAQAIQDTERLLDEDVRAIEALREKMRGLDEQVIALRAEFGAADTQIRVGPSCARRRARRSDAVRGRPRRRGLRSRAPGRALPRSRRPAARRGRRRGRAHGRGRRAGRAARAGSRRSSVPDEDEESEATEGDGRGRQRRAPADAGVR